MKKLEFYYLLIISGLIDFMSTGILEEVSLTDKSEHTLPFIYFVLLFIFSGTLIFNIKKIKLKIENLYLIKHTIYFKISIIALIFLTLHFITVQIISSIIFLKQGFTIPSILYVLIGVFSVFIYLLIKLFIAIKNRNNSAESEGFIHIGELSEKADQSQFPEKKELNIDRKTYKNYKPILCAKKYNNTGDLILDYTNKEDLTFTVLIKDCLSVFIRVNSKHKSVDLIETEIFKSISSVTNKQLLPKAKKIGIPE